MKKNLGGTVSNLVKNPKMLRAPMVVIQMRSSIFRRNARFGCVRNPIFRQKEINEKRKMVSPINNRLGRRGVVNKAFNLVFLLTLI